MAKFSRTKGHCFEREIASVMRKLFPKARRHLEYHGEDANGVDIANTGRLKIQCKRKRAFAPITAIFEIEHDPFSDIPILVTKADHAETMAVLPLDDLLDLLGYVAETEDGRDFLNAPLRSMGDFDALS